MRTPTKYVQILSQRYSLLTGFQNPLKSYGAVNVAKIRSVAKKYDPNGVVQTKAPRGFKVSKVSSN